MINSDEAHLKKFSKDHSIRIKYCSTNLIQDITSVMINWTLHNGCSKLVKHRKTTWFDFHNKFLIYNYIYIYIIHT